MMKQLSTIILLIAFSNIAYSQCTGNLGENIFTDGDFGSGAANILTPDPQIAPGYTYEFNPPPIDGTYSITNNTTSWGSFANPNWANISDNSSDPNGYMMIVNASFDPGLFYEQLVDGLCENTLYVFEADIFNLAAGIKPNVSFLLDGINLYDTGDIPLNNQWNTYGFTFTTSPGQTSITLALQNNAPGGNGNDLALDNITFRVCGPEALVELETVADVCEGAITELKATVIGDQYNDPQIQWQESLDGGLTWIDIPGANALTYTHNNSDSGSYYYRYLLANALTNLMNSKCRVVSNVEIIEIIPELYIVNDTICEGLTYPMGDSLYTITGIYMDSFLTVDGCDSIVTLNLEVVPDIGINPAFSIIDPSCYEYEDGSMFLENIENGIAPYTIIFNGEIDEDGNISDLSAGDYNYLITDHYGCSYDTIINLTNPPEFNIEIGEDIFIELGETVEINPSYSLNAFSFDWSADYPIDCESDCRTLDWLPLGSTQVVLTATTETGCTASDSLYIDVFNVRKVFIPNAFTPDFNGYNDYFNIYASVPNVQQIDELIIFNRWGGIVHSRENFLPNGLADGWDGKYKGKLLEVGVYIYLVKIRFLDGEVLLYKGDLTLLR
jgi:gliding motility-associated-like protein